MPQLPALTVGDFGPGKEHVAEGFVHDKVFVILHRDDPARAVAPLLQFPADDDYVYLVIHGGDEVTRFQNAHDQPTHEIPETVTADLLRCNYGSRLDGMKVRVCACYGNLLRPGDTATAVQLLARELVRTAFEGYHGLVHLRSNPPHVQLGLSVQWDPQCGAVVVGPPGPWEPVFP